MPLINDHLVFKLQEIQEFCEYYCGSESYEIPNLPLKQAQANDLKRKIEEIKNLEQQNKLTKEIAMVKRSMKEMSFTDEQGRQSTIKSVVSTD